MHSFIRSMTKSVRTNAPLDAWEGRREVRVSRAQLRELAREADHLPEPGQRMRSRKSSVEDRTTSPARTDLRLYGDALSEVGAPCARPGGQTRCGSETRRLDPGRRTLSPNGPLPDGG